MGRIEYSNIRVSNKHDTPENWNVSNLIPLDGEIFFYDYEDGNGNTIYKMKIGNGKSTPGQLPFVFCGLSEENKGENFNDYETNQALGLWSHVEGGRCKDPDDVERHNVAKGTRAHIEGSGNTITEDTYDAHVEGSLNIGSHNQVHVEGYMNIASEHQAHAEGNTTTASGKQSHSEGWNTIASGNYAHTEGTGTQATHTAGHAEGQGTKALNEQAHSEGYNSEATGQVSHAEGRNTQAIGYASHSGGSYSSSTGAGSFSHGIHTVANGNGQFVVGIANQTDSNALFIVGNGDASQWNNTVTKQSNAFKVDKLGNTITQNSFQIDKKGQKVNLGADGLSVTWTENGQTQTKTITWKQLFEKLGI